MQPLLLFLKVSFQENVDYLRMPSFASSISTYFHFWNVPSFYMCTHISVWYFKYFILVWSGRREVGIRLEWFLETSYLKRNYLPCLEWWEDRVTWSRERHFIMNSWKENKYWEQNVNSPFLRIIVSSSNLRIINREQTPPHGEIEVTWITSLSSKL